VKTDSIEVVVASNGIRRGRRTRSQTRHRGGKPLFFYRKIKEKIVIDHGYDIAVGQIWTTWYYGEAEIISKGGNYYTAKNHDHKHEWSVFASGGNARDCEKGGNLVELLLVPDQWNLKDKWVPWSGGECPVDGDLKVIVKRRDEKDDNSKRESYIAKEMKWGHFSTDEDIVAYKLEEVKYE